jgi:hypothetical protein
MSVVGFGGDDMQQQANLGDAWRIAMDQVRKEEEEAMDNGTYNYGFKPIEKIDEVPTVAGGGFMSGAF